MKNKLSAADRRELLAVLKTRFDKNKGRHKGIDWGTVEERLENSPDKLLTLAEMERTGGEPDVIGSDKNTGEIIFADCSAESPKGRRSFCYDPPSLASRKENKPANSAIGMADEIGIAILTEAEYRDLQKLGEFDLKTSSWIAAPPEVRALGGAIFCDRRFGRIFTYHNGAESYYASRGFRGSLRV